MYPFYQNANLDDTLVNSECVCDCLKTHKTVYYIFTSNAFKIYLFSIASEILNKKVTFFLFFFWQTNFRETYFYDLNRLSLEGKGNNLTCNILFYHHGLCLLFFFLSKRNMRYSNVNNWGTPKWYFWISEYTSFFSKQIHKVNVAGTQTIFSMKASTK